MKYSLEDMQRNKVSNRSYFTIEKTALLFGITRIGKCYIHK